MFVRPAWRPLHEDEGFRIIDEYPWALLLSNGDDGPFCTNLPFLLDQSRTRLLGHIARANEHAAALLASKTPSLAVFQGPWAYVSPSWYPNRDMPGTYYYSAVHVYGRVREQSVADLEKTLGILNDKMEGPIPNGWRMDEVPHSEITRRLPSIAGFEIDIERIETKLKYGQDEPKKDAMAVAERLLASEDQWQRKLGEGVRRENIGRAQGLGPRAQTARNGEP